ncbi:MAG TPA: permease prefix domain 1-containing protein, partial [Bryobacteraceae bacterium]|nr:permease prefix domain 1-containing protein [Bryobacteraceae bacterium]
MWFRKRTDGDFQDEIESHIRMESDRLIAEGMTASEARESARRAFGNIGVSRERFYEAQRWMWWDELRRNIRYGLRALAKHPSFTAAAALTIALGVGANTAVFSLMDAMLLRPLPVSDPASLVFVTAAGKRGAPAAPPYRVFSELREKSRSFEGMAAYATDELRIEIGGHPEAVNGQITSGSYFRLLGVKSSL